MKLLQSSEQSTKLEMTNKNMQINVLKLLLLLVHYSLLIRCQSATSNLATTTDLPANSTQSDTLKNNSITTTTTSTTTSMNPTLSSDVLLSANEFVDFTEAPIILFDGLSKNESNETTTSSPQQVPTTTTTTTISQQNSTTKTTSSTSTSTETSTIIDDLVDGDSGDEEAPDDEAQDYSKDFRRDFDPPQNVSQYMDYIERLFHDLRHQITDLFEPHIPQLIRTSQMVQLSGSCSYDMLRMALALRQFEPWALKMIDSSGKVPEGIFEGSFTALGSYDQCLSTVFASTAPSSTSSSSSAAAAAATAAASPATQTSPQSASGNQLASQTQGKYCLVNVSPYLPPKPPADRVERMFQEEANRRNYTKDDQFSRLSPMFYYMKFRIGVCIPSTCLDSDVHSISNALSASLRLNITIPNCRIKQFQPITNHQLVGGVVFGLILALVAGATLMDYSKRRLEFARKEILMLNVAAGVTSAAGEDTKVPVLLRTRALLNVTKNNFERRLDKHWSWMSFSLMTNYKLYFKNKAFKAFMKQQDSHYHHHHHCQLATNAPQQTAGTSNSTIIRCLNGIRVLSLCWVIVANSYVTLDPRATKRLTKTREAPKDFLFQVVAQASLAIETFFFLSGILMSLSFKRKLNPQVSVKKAEVEKAANNQLETGTGSINNRPVEPKYSHSSSYTLRSIHFYVHRYIRMTPATMLVIAFTMFAFRYGDGPLWFEATHKAHQSCSQNWWRHLLHVANYIDTRQMCFIHYWYIAADMQLFLFAPLLMFLINRRRRIGYAIATLIGLLSVGSIFYTTYMQNLPPTLLFYNSDPESRREFGNTIMTKPLTHALPYMVGMLLGNWLSAQTANHPHRHHPLAEEQTTKTTVTTLLGLIATMVALAEVFLPYKWNNLHLPTRFLAALYAALFRFGWSLVLAYIVISCRHRRGRGCRDERGDKVNSHQAAVADTTDCRCCFQRWQKRSTVIVEPRNKTGLIGQVEEKLNHNLRSESLNQQTVVWCMCGSGGSLLNRLLSWSIFTHLSKLSFTAYLIHLPLMSVFIAQTRGLFAFSHTLVIHLALSYLVMTFILSFLLVHIIELPFITFERYLFDKWFYTRKCEMSPSNKEFENGIDKTTRMAATKAATKQVSDLKSCASMNIIKEEQRQQSSKNEKGIAILDSNAILTKDQSNNHHLNYVTSERL